MLYLMKGVSAWMEVPDQIMIFILDYYDKYNLKIRVRKKNFLKQNEYK